MRRIILGIGAGWAAIIALAWYLADARAFVFRYDLVRESPLLHQRDNVLIVGLLVPLVAFALVVFTAWKRSLHMTVDRDTSAAKQQRLRDGPHP